jgi:multidrug resistance protein MdtO
MMSLLDFLASDLSPREGRWAAVTRVAIGCAVTVSIAMIFKIPQPTYMAYIVFVVSKDDTAATLTSAIGGLCAVTLAIVLTLGLSLIDTGEPSLRLPIMALATYFAMFTSRTFALGPVSYLAGFVIVLLQSLVDDVPSSEALTRATLWAFVVILVPVMVTVLVNLLFGHGAELSKRRAVVRILGQLEQFLTDRGQPAWPHQWRAQLAALLPAAGHEAREAARDNAIPASAVVALLNSVMILESFPVRLPEAAANEAAAGVRECRDIIESGGKSAKEIHRSTECSTRDGTGFSKTPAYIAFQRAIFLLRDSLIHPVMPLSGERPERRPFVADAFTNPAHWQFALKTTMAVMVSYGIYTLLNWPGLRTSIVTCFFVALSSLGETVHKLILRLSGAMIGGLVAGLCIVFVLPHLTDIGQLCLLIGAVSLAAAWVATSSELLAYAGMQIAFAFFLGILQGYAPATDLTVLRDRIIGILLGNIVVTIIFSSLWPESVLSGIRRAVADALRAIGDLITGESKNESARARTIKALIRAEHLQSVSLLELRLLPRHVSVGSNIPSVADMGKLAGAAFVVASDPLVAQTDPRSMAVIEQWTKAAADDVLGNRALRSAPPIAPTSRWPRRTGVDSRFVRSAIEQLQLEVRHVASSP